MTFTVNRLGPQFEGGAFAAELLGANLHEPPGDELIDAFEEAMATYAVVVLRDQDIDDEEQVRFARAFGPLELPPHMGMRPAAMKVRVGFGLYDISNLDVDGNFLPEDSLRLIFNKGNENFHTDSSFNMLPTKWSMLSARVVPPEGRRHRVLRCARSLGRTAGRSQGTRRTGHRRTLAVEDARRRRKDADHRRDAQRHATRAAPRGAHVSRTPAASRCTSARMSRTSSTGRKPTVIASSRRSTGTSPIRRFATCTSGASATCWSGTTAARCIGRRRTRCSEHKRDMRRATINEYGPEVSSTTALGIPPPMVNTSPY